MRSTMSIAVAALASSAAARTFTVKNACPFTVWPAVYTDPNVGHAKPDVPTGWKAPPGSSRTFNVPNGWTSGRIWGRTDCDASGRCASGTCAGGLICDSVSGTGAAPASLAEWTLKSSGDRDFYDVSLVDGYNLPMSITNNAGCPVADCSADLLPACPSQLRVTNSSGAVVGCKSSCGWDGNTANSGDCCTGSYGTPETCPPSGVKYYSYFKSSCPNSYVFAYDERSGTALWTCDASKAADYTLTFCPNGANEGAGYGPGSVKNPRYPAQAGSSSSSSVHHKHLNPSTSDLHPAAAHTAPPKLLPMVKPKPASSTFIPTPSKHRCKHKSLQRLRRHY